MSSVSQTPSQLCALPLRSGASHLAPPVCWAGAHSPHPGISAKVPASGQRLDLYSIQTALLQLFVPIHRATCPGIFLADRMPRCAESTKGRVSVMENCNKLRENWRDRVMPSRRKSGREHYWSIKTPQFKSMQTSEGKGAGKQPQIPSFGPSSCRHWGCFASVTPLSLALTVTFWKHSKCCVLYPSLCASHKRSRKTDNWLF